MTLNRFKVFLEKNQLCIVKYVRKYAFSSGHRPGLPVKTVVVAKVKLPVRQYNHFFPINGMVKRAALRKSSVFDTATGTMLISIELKRE